MTFKLLHEKDIIPEIKTFEKIDLYCQFKISNTHKIRCRFVSPSKECMICIRTRTLTNVKGDSVKRQKSLIMKWVKSNGYSVRGEYWDVESGSKDTMDRPEFMRMISDYERMDI